MEKKLLLLGLLLSQSMHGYQLNEMLKSNIGIPITLKKSNAYKILDDMEKNGWVTHKEDKEGNRPTRRVYTVTKGGKEVFYSLLRENLSTCPTPEFPGVVGLDFAYSLPSDEVVKLLEKRYKMVEKKFKQFDEVSEEIRKGHLSVEYFHNYYGNELKWLKKIIKRIGKEK